MGLFRNSLSAFPLTLAIVAVSGNSLVAQGTGTTTTTTTTTATCTTAPTSVTALSLESVLTLNNVLSTTTPNIPANILAGITSGAAEIRARTIYNPQANALTVTVFTVAPGSPNPTPILTNITGTTLGAYTMNVTNTLFSCQPVPSVLFVGTISGANGGFSAYNGAPAAISLGYTTASPPAVNNLVALVAGTVVSYSGSATDVALTFPAASVSPPGTGNPPVIVLNPAIVNGGTFQAFLNPFYIDASQSTDPKGLPLTYTWSSNPPANFQPSSTTNASQTITFTSGSGNYNITLTVTDSSGASATSNFILTYISK